jgi:hypothetical protein
VNILEAQGASITGTQVDARSGDLSTVAGDSILASVSVNEDLSTIPLSVNADTNMQQQTDVSSLPAGNGDDKAGVDMKHSIINNEPDGVSSAEKTVRPSSTTVEEDPKDDTVEVNAIVDADVGKMTAATCKLRPLLHKLSGSCPEFDLSGNIAKILEERKGLLEERKGLKELLKDVGTSTILASPKQQAIKDSLQKKDSLQLRILNANNIDVSFENFPYYLRCKYLLVNFSDLISCCMLP